MQLNLWTQEFFHGCEINIQPHDIMTNGLHV